MKSTKNELARVLKWQKANWQKVLEYKRRWRERHPTKMQNARDNWRKNNLERIRQNRRIWASKNARKLADQEKARRAKDPELARKKGRAHYHANKDSLTDYQRKFRDKNRELVRHWSRENHRRHKEKRIEANRLWKTQNKDKVRKQARAWLENNREKVRERKRNLRHTNPNIWVGNRLRSRITSVLKRNGTRKNNTTVTLIGISLDGFRKHLESLFLPGMTWDNRGLWHIDHKIPCASFNLHDVEQVKKCFHYTNLQPLWAQDNMSKGKKIAA
jgi:hypothetical protein